MPLWMLAVAAVPLAWLVPNHYYPWVSAWPDGLALALLAIAMLCVRGGVRLAWPWVLFCATVFCIVLAQAATGLIFFAGDAWMVLLYLTAFAGAMVIGGQLAGTRGHQGSHHEAGGAGVDQGGDGLSALATAILVGAIASVGIAAVQWTGALGPGMWVVEMSLAGRPFGNVAQPNHLCTICFLGLASAGILRERGRISNVGLWVAAIWCIFGMVMSGSRTGWLQFAFLVIFVLVAGLRTGLTARRNPVLALAGVYALAIAIWPTINDILLLSGRELEEAGQSGTRPLHWRAMLGAIAREPWLGYGWQQVSVAQVRGAELNPVVGEHIEHSHNLALDLLVWNGIPLGALLFGLMLWWFLSRVFACKNPVAAWLLAGVGGLGLHAMLEYPLDFAYFLIPLGLFAGAVDALLARPSLGVPRRAMQASAVAFAALLAGVGYDYAQAEPAHRLLRLESARIGVAGIQTPPPRLHLLTQLDAYLRFAQTPATTGMSREDIDWMRRVSERFAYPPSMLRYALAAGLNGAPEQARQTLARLCRMHPMQRCEEGRESWAAARQKYPQLHDIPPPDLP